MPSLRLLSVAVLVGMGAAAAAVSGLTGSDHSDQADAPTSAVRGGLVAGASVTPSATGALDVQAENARPGTKGWRISRAQGGRAGLEAYAGAISVRAGEAVPLLVSGQGVVRVTALRIGWYGGTGARRQWEGSLRAHPEPADPTKWQARGWAVTTGWPEGHYLLRLDQTGIGQQPVSRYVPLTIRSADSRGRILVLTSPLSWQAENSPASAADSSLPHAASFDRPYASGYGAGGFLVDDDGLVEQAERSGRPLAYATDHDLAVHPELLAGATAILVGGDSRYWTTSLRSAVRKAADAGTNLAFFGTGTGSRRVVLADQGRTEKILGGAPSKSVRLTGQRPSCPGASSSSTAFTVPGGGVAGWNVANEAWWGYRGTKIHTGDVVPGLVAASADRSSATATARIYGTTKPSSSSSAASSSTPSGSASPGSASSGSAPSSAKGAPAPVAQVLAFTQINCGPSGSDVQAAVQSAVYQVRSSKAGVFATGAGQWVCSLADVCIDSSGSPVTVKPRTRRFARKVTLNVIDAFATAKAGRHYPAHDSVAQYALLR